MRPPLAALIVVIAGLLSGCGSPTPRFASGDEAEFSAEGLRLLEHSGFQRGWARPGVSFAGYGAVWPRYPAGIAYRDPPRFARTELGGDNYPLRDGLAAQLMTSLRETFRSKLTRAGGWQHATSTAPEVLEVRVALIDLVMHAPLNPLGGDDLQWIDSLGEVTLVIEISDSETGEVIARLVERDRLAPESTRPVRASPRDATYEAGRLFRQWAGRLRVLLDAMKHGDLLAS